MLHNYNREIQGDVWNRYIQIFTPVDHFCTLKLLKRKTECRSYRSYKYGINVSGRQPERS